MVAFARPEPGANSVVTTKLMKHSPSLVSRNETNPGSRLPPKSHAQDHLGRRLCCPRRSRLKDLLRPDHLKANRACAVPIRIGQAADDVEKAGREGAAYATNQFLAHVGGVFTKSIVSRFSPICRTPQEGTGDFFKQKSKRRDISRRLQLAPSGE